MPSTVEIVQGALVEAQATGARIVLVQHADGDPDRSWIDQVKGKSTDGVIAVHSVLEESERRRLEEQSVALVVINPKDAPHVGAHSVGATNWTGGLVATRHLLDLGHRRIGMLCGDEDSLVSRARVSGYREAIESAGARLASDLTFSGRFTFESGLERGRELLARPDRPTAVFAGSDAQAMGVLEAARLLGISVPEELSVIGFDDLVTASMTAPPLTTIRQPFDLMGAAAIAVTLELIEGRVPQSHHVELATSLIVRGTTARLRGSAEGAWPRT
jgi:DNA-binding LacI/PurR family transcriptional regulator